MNETTEIATVCPGGCDAAGADVYRADAHPVTCRWMMDNPHRCAQHDELLRPDETTCPHPDVSEDATDPHRRVVN